MCSIIFFCGLVALLYVVLQDDDSKIVVDIPAHKGKVDIQLGQEGRVDVKITAGNGLNDKPKETVVIKSEPDKTIVDKLKSLGFVRNQYGDLEIAKIKLKDAMKELGFSVLDMKPTRSQSRYSDIRTVIVSNVTLTIFTLELDKRGNMIKGSLDSPESQCNIVADIQNYSDHYGGVRIRVACLIVLPPGG